MARTPRAVAVGVGGIAVLGLFVLMASGGGPGTDWRRRLAPDTSEALLEENIRKWAHVPGTPPEPALVHIVGRQVHGSGAPPAVNAYKSAPNELVWLDGKRRGKICATAELPEVETPARHWLSYAQRAWSPGGGPAPTPTPEESAALSHFHVGHSHKTANYDHTGAHYVEPIEPLHGVGRHPFAQIGCPSSEGHEHRVDIYDITYLVIHNDCSRPGPKPRTLLFDMGASVGFKGVPGGIYATMPENGGHHAPSLPLFYRMYEDRCLEPDAVFAWEPSPRVSGSEWWGELPAQIRAKVRFFQDIVDEGDLSQAEAHGQHPAQSFLEVLESVATPDDFVAVKVDIDTPNAELTIMDHRRSVRDRRAG